MGSSRREVLAGMAIAALVPGSACAAGADNVLTPEAFGARGDGRTNDTNAFAALAAHVNARGGGTVVLRPVIYLVGAQTQPDSPGGATYPPAEAIMHFLRCTGSVIVRGNGAVLRCAAGLRFGIFDPRSGRPTTNSKPRQNRGQVASPYLAMVRAEGCSGLVEISDIELDGNVAGLEIGGKSSKDGWQIAASGIQLIENSGPERLSRILTHHHALDGLTLYSPPGRRSSTTLSEVRSDYNGRQGCSVTGGRNYSFDNCRFRHTGRAGLSSPPAAGVDIEAGRHPIRNVSFTNCEFSDNAGAGLIADSGDTEGVQCIRCTFVGTTSRAVWPKKPRMRFTDCLFVGSIIHAYGDSEPDRAAQFLRCRFTDDPALSPTGRIFGGRGRRQTIAELPNNPNVLFSRCRFELSHDLLLPTSTSAVIYADCVMSQRAPGRSHPAGTYRGVNTITGNVSLAGSRISGDVFLNGRKVQANLAAVIDSQARTPDSDRA